MAKDIKRSKSLGHKTKSFFGLDSDLSFDEVDAWNQRRLKFCVSKYGNINCDKLKYEGLDTSLLADSVAGNVDDVDASLPASSWAQGPPSLNRTITNCSRSYMVGSVITPQSSVTISGAPVKKKHAFRALATAVATTLSDHADARKRQQLYGQPLETICDEVEEPTIANYTAVKLESIPPTSFAGSTKPTKMLHWSESLVDRVRSGVRRLDVQRRFTDSFMGNFMCCMPTRNRDTKMLVTQIDDLPQYRPYFTYWICVVQIIVFIAALSYYGLAPIKLDFVNSMISEVQTPSGSIEQVCRVDYVNLFIGLRQADLIRLGARYSPCMRQDKNLQLEIIEQQRIREKRSGCCIRNDGGGCFQTSRTLCSTTLATWQDVNKQGRRTVCGLDPDFCDDPRSIAPFEWSDNVLEWPICKAQSSVNSTGTTATRTHMQCDVTGRPCCIGSKAECIITTRQHCQFLRGYYHPEAALCSQISCLNEICGMLNFYNPEKPDQFYRLFTAIFLNSSIGSLVVTLAIQLSVMRDLEKMAGWHRVAIIYILSGMIGNLTSGIFLPYQVQSGSSGGIFALLAMTFTEFLQSWKIVESPLQVLFKFLGLGLFLFVLGFLPFFDNYAHMSGLFCGVLLSFILLPFVGRPTATVLLEVLNTAIDPDLAFKKFQQDSKRKRLTIIIGCTVLWLLLTTLCFILFYWKPVTQCSWCKYFNCIPFDTNFCDNMDVNITTKTACVIKE